MNSEHWMRPVPASALLAAVVMGCSGPWNMEVDSEPPPVRLQVSCMLVAGRPFAGLWLERPLSFYQKYDSSKSFVDTASSEVYIVRDDSDVDTVRYRMSASNSRIWLPADDGDTVRPGARYRLRAHVRWNAAREFPSGSEMRTDTLVAESRVQPTYAVDRTVLAPIEALHPALSMGLPAGIVEEVLGNPGDRLGRLYDSLGGIRSLSDKGITQDDLLAYLQGREVMRPLRDGDSAFYIFDASDVPDPDGGGNGTIKRYSRQWKFRQEVAASEYGGVVISGGFDTSRARIWSPLSKSLSTGFGESQPDPEEFYQPGQSRIIAIVDDTPGKKSGYPETLALDNASLGYTGTNTLYFYAVDAHYARERAQESDPATGDLSTDFGGGDEEVRPSHSNIKGGTGYFSTAVQDSFTVYIEAVSPDTFSVPELRRDWLNDKGSF